MGFIFFLVPYPVNGESKISIAHFIDLVNRYESQFISFTLVIAILIIVLTFLFKFYTSKINLLNDLFKCNIPNFIARITGFSLYVIVVLQLFNSNFIFSILNDEYTGQVMAGPGGLITTLFITFFIGLLALPLLTHFGAVEFIGTITAPIVKKVFKVPGYSAVDAIASFVGDGTIGIVVTDSQYQRGYYTKREAYIIATSFSIVGIAFATAVAEELGLIHIFPIFYGSIALVTIIIAIITARLPLTKFEDEYYPDANIHHIQELPQGTSVFTYAVDLAEIQASSAKIKDIILHTFKQIAHVYIGFIPIIMLVGTIGLVIAEQTSVFTWITYPLIYFYQIFGFDFETASSMAPATVIGFADMYLPALLVSGLESATARFIIGVLAFTQLIFMSETGMVLVKSKIGVNVFDLLKIFIFRTVISLPFVIGIAFFLEGVGLL